MPRLSARSLFTENIAVPLVSSRVLFRFGFSVSFVAQPTRQTACSAAETRKCEETKEGGRLSHRVYCIQCNYMPKIIADNNSFLRQIPLLLLLLLMPLLHFRLRHSLFLSQQQPVTFYAFSTEKKRKENRKQKRKRIIILRYPKGFLWHSFTICPGSFVRLVFLDKVKRLNDFMTRVTHTKESALWPTNGMGASNSAFAHLFRLSIHHCIISCFVRSFAVCAMSGQRPLRFLYGTSYLRPCVMKVLKVKGNIVDNNPFR